MTEEFLLVNFKNLMRRWFPLTSEVEEDFQHTLDKLAVNYDGLRDADVVILTDTFGAEGSVFNQVILPYLTQYGVEEYLLNEYVGAEEDTVFVWQGKYFYYYDSTRGSVNLLNDYDVKLEASSYNVNIGGSVNLTATLTDKMGNPIPYKNVVLYKNGSSLFNGITNNQGIVTFIVTCSDGGLLNFSVGNTNCQVVNNLIEDSLSTSSTNAVQNKVVTTALNGKQASLSVETTNVSVTSPTSGSNYFSGGTREILARRYGKIVNVSINFYNVGSKQANTSTDTTIGTMPTGWRPAINQYARASYTNKTDIHNTSFMINTSGTISIRTLTTTAQTSVTYRASFTYIVA